MTRAVQDTDIDALSAKLACLEYKYLPPDPPVAFHSKVDVPYTDYTQYHQMYWQALVQANQNHNRRLVGKLRQNIRHSSPVMNYGTYLRTVAIDLNICQYLHELTQISSTDVQIINLGCGSDLRFIQFLQKYHTRIKAFIDIDLKDTIELKNKILQNLLPKLDLGFKWGDKYVATSCDLNSIESYMEILQNYTDKDIPTIIITECVLCYMTRENSQNLIDSMQKFFHKGIWLSYDPIGGDEPNDKFGIIMQQNLLNSRNLNMPTLLEFNSKLSYSSRWGRYKLVNIQNLLEFLNENITPLELQRLQKCQFLDELEELKIMQSHYIILQAQW